MKCGRDSQPVRLFEDILAGQFIVRHGVVCHEFLALSRLLHAIVVAVAASEVKLEIRVFDGKQVTIFQQKRTP